MRIYRERIPLIARGIVDALRASELVEVEAEMVDEVVLDVESVLTMYRKTDYELSEKARDIVAAQGLDYSKTQKIKRDLAAEQRFGIGDEAIEWIVQQTLEILLQSRNVEEVYGEDHELRRVIAPVLKRELGVEGELDQEVRKHLKNLQEGTTDYDIEYQKTLAKVRQAKGLGD